MSAARGLHHVNPKAGTFVLVAVLVAVSGLFLAGRARGWFEPHLDVETTSVSLPSDSTLGLEPGVEVQILGNTVGTVVQVSLDQGSTVQPSNEVPMHFTMRVRGPLMKLVRTDSIVQIKRKFGVAGSAYMLICAGKGPPATEGTKLECVIAPDITTTIEETMRNLNRPDGPLQRTLTDALTVADNLAAGKGAAGLLLNDPATAQQIKTMLSNMQAITAELARAQSPVGRLLNDPKTGEALTGVITSARGSLDSVDKLLIRTQEADLNGFMQQVKQTLGQVENTLKEVSATTASLRMQAKDLPGLVAQTQEMMRQTTRMMEGMQRTWLLRDHVAAEGSSKLSPSDVTSP